MRYFQDIYLLIHNIKIQMGCDYVIIKELIVEYFMDGNIHTENLELDCEKCYFNDSIHEDLNYDSDDSNISIIFDELYYLKVNHIPRIIYQNKKWRNSILQDKYENFVNNELELNKDINKITKVERRYLK